MVLHYFGITPSNEFDKNTAETQRISKDNIDDLVHLHRKLDKFPFCTVDILYYSNVNYRGPFYP